MADRPSGGWPSSRRLPAITRARADLDAGRLWKARDRLEGLRSQKPADQEVLGLLGEVLYEMGDLPAAGQTWFLTTREGDEVEWAFAAMRERTGGRAQALATQLKVRPPLAHYPEPVRRRLQDLAAHAREEGAHVRWEKHSDPDSESAPSPSLLREVNAALALAVLVLPWLLGVATVVYGVVRLVGVLL